MSNPVEINGGSVIAMAGKQCVAIACDTRLGNQALLISSHHEKVFPITARTYLGLPGLATDTATVYEKLRHRVNMYAMKEDRTISPETFTHLVSSTLYEKRFGNFFVEPVVAGLKDDGTPWIASTDVIGCINFAKDFVLAGTASEKLYGMAESLWEPDLGPDELFETISQALLSAIDRDAFSHGGAVWIIEPHQVTKRILKARLD